MREVSQTGDYSIFALVHFCSTCQQTESMHHQLMLHRTWRVHCTQCRVYSAYTCTRIGAAGVWATVPTTGSDQAQVADASCLIEQAPRGGYWIP